jgi:hypothetical protein
MNLFRDFKEQRARQTRATAEMRELRTQFKKYSIRRVGAFG